MDLIGMGILLKHVRKHVLIINILLYKMVMEQLDGVVVIMIGIMLQNMEKNIVVKQEMDGATMFIKIMM